MKLSEFAYSLPKELIAQHPLPERDASRLLVLQRRDGTIRHLAFRDLPSLLRLGDRLVVNDTRVLQVRILGFREGGTGLVELLLIRAVEGKEGRPTYDALARPARKLVEGTILRMGERRVPIRVVGERDTRTRTVEFPPGFQVREFLNSEGHVPLPPYIQRDDEDEDRERYQTIFAARPGAVAAPTAGLHFTPEILTALSEAGIARSTITLEVGWGTFAPVRVDAVEDHAMERERYRVSPEAAEEITGTRQQGGRVVAVGTTVVRALETAAHPIPELQTWGPRAVEGWTEAFIHPPYEFRLVDALLTNFHLPRSTLLMLVCAFGGKDLVIEAYREAVDRKYRFYSYGDAMLVL